MSRLLLTALCLWAGLACGEPRIDPTQPPAGVRPDPAAEKGQPPAPLVLQAILRSAQGSRAVVNGEVLRVGEEKGGLRLLAIYPQAVTIEREGQRSELRLVEPVLKPSR